DSTCRRSPGSSTRKASRNGPRRALHLRSEQSTLRVGCLQHAGPGRTGDPLRQVHERGRAVRLPFEDLSADTGGIMQQDQQAAAGYAPAGRPARRAGREAARATGWGLAVTLVLAALIVVGSRNLAHFDAALVAYTFAVLFATFGLTYRYAMWLQRPPTAVYWRRGWQAF